jgi:hypothetical protein
MKLKNLFLSLALVFASLTSVFGAATAVDVVAGGTAYNVLAVPANVFRIQFTSTTTNASVLRLYDSSNTTTNYVSAAYTNFVSYATNYNTTITNADGVLVTNTFVGTFTGPVTVAAATNTRPIIAIVVAPASGTATRTVNFQTVKGLVVVGSNPGVLEVDYRQ